MDLNRLYFDHQVLLMQARAAKAGDKRQGLETGARRIACRIGSIQRHSGASAAKSWEDLSALPGVALCSTLTAKGFDAPSLKSSNANGAK